MLFDWEKNKNYSQKPKILKEKSEKNVPKALNQNFSLKILAIMIHPLKFVSKPMGATNIRTTG